MTGKKLDSGERVTIAYSNREEHEMSRIKGLAAIFGAAVLMAVIAACGSAAEPTSLSDEVPTLAPPTVGGTTPTDSRPPTTPFVSHGGPVKDYVSLVDTLRAAGATVDPAGPESFADYFTPQGQLLTVNGERVSTFEFSSAEEADAAAEGVSASGTTIRGPIMADGSAMITAVDWATPAHFYKAGKLIVLYVACDVDVINLLQETMGPQFAGGAGMRQCPERVPPTTPVVSHGGPVKDYVSLADTLRAAGATVDPAGPESFADYFTPQGQLLTVNGERVSTFEFSSAEEADAAAEGVSADGSSIVGPIMADGTAISTAVDWITPAHFYKAGKLIVLYVACDVDVINLLQETMGPQFAGGAGLSQCPERIPPTNMEIRQALETAEGSQVTVSGFLFADTAGNTRLCSGLLESYPPQCGGDRIDLLGFDASTVPNSQTPQAPSEIGTARWTDSFITVTGIKGIAGLAEVRLSTEAAAIVGGTAPEEEPATSHSPIEFVMEETYALGQDIEIKIRNNGTESYVYSEYYPACRNLEFYDGLQQARQLERLSGIVELSPGLFIVPEGTHCDIANESQIKPGEEVALLTWSQHECVKDKWVCRRPAIMSG